LEGFEGFQEGFQLFEGYPHVAHTSSG